MATKGHHHQSVAISLLCTGSVGNSSKTRKQGLNDDIYVTIKSSSPVMLDTIVSMIIKTALKWNTELLVKKVLIFPVFLMENSDMRLVHN